MIETDLRNRIADLEAENVFLRRSILNQRGDNLCWFEPAAGAKIPPAKEFLESCRRYHAQVSELVGVLSAGQMTIAQLEACAAALPEASFLEEVGVRLVYEGTVIAKTPWRVEMGERLLNMAARIRQVRP